MTSLPIRSRAAVVALLLGASMVAGAQAPSTETAKALQGDFAVPDAPALLMLGIEDSKLLRPSSVQALTSGIRSELNTFATGPQAFAVEFSPLMLWKGPSLSIGEYQAKKFLYRTRFSFGANKDAASGRSQAAIALRLSLNDDQDLRTNADFLKAVGKLTALKIDSARQVLNALSANRIPRVGTLTQEQQAKKDSIIAAIAEERQLAPSFSDSLVNAGTDMANAIAAVKRAKESTSWNASVTDVAAGVRVSSLDSTSRRGRLDGVAGWLTKGVAVHDFAQVLLGVRGAWERDSTTEAALHSAGDVVLRAYLGSNQYKVSLEGGATGRASSQPQWAFKIGGEFEAVKSLWIDFAAGWQATGDLRGGALTHTVSFRLGPPNQ